MFANGKTGGGAFGMKQKLRRSEIKLRRMKQMFRRMKQKLRWMKQMLRWMKQKLRCSETEAPSGWNRGSIWANKGCAFADNK
ncbi:hypothetical protein [Bacteroides pyogenes]|uniref:Uncharacterized protein n=2 Tax=Bacteroides pyogenes TaxID=310300 RepID=W4PGP2_9BACE|nr:hypothetical protein [Bacteroides pyogenes]GAE16971.1 hypothetical protein JCM6292_3490 [Bacteroides pyogenes JCM 6292]GAE18927.1 hypothetical protein JCM6294_1895 [Bacteroides pyogenes DSM 20611 = JCM 6294]